SADNEIEIVIHVNMLKEGWDVTNLYTIVPLRAANAAVLIEQTIGRGLRLPYGGKRTGVDKIDKLTVVAHENFEAVIAEAQNPESVLNKMSYVELDTEDLSSKTIVVTSKPVMEQTFEKEQERINIMPNVQEKQKAQNTLDAKKAIIDVLPDFNSMPEVRRVEDLSKPKVKEKVLRKVKANMNKPGMTGNLFEADILEEASEKYDSIVSEYKKNIIEIPRMDLVQGETRAEFMDFELDVSGFSFQALDQEIIRMNLKDKQVETLKAKSSGWYGQPIKLIIAELINYPEIDYDENSELLYRLATQAYEAIKGNIKEVDELPGTIFQYKSAIAEKIYKQMKEHFVLHTADYVAPKVFPFINIEQWSFTTMINGGFKDFREVVNPTVTIPKYVFMGFEKACHSQYKFDSKAEQDLAFVMENDATVSKWMRPAPAQFRIYWDNNSKRYEPDFIAETDTTIYMIEVKRSDQTEEETVLAKKAAAERYCKYATEYTTANGGKKWEYLLLPHNEVNRTASFSFLATRFKG
ncbi:MAG: restriction endonuclease subunit R, partial [Bacteroidales bacterium]|nr:restriction endonuclease subunit R [Bacteroidales bacterium]